MKIRVLYRSHEH
jgi:hypothetical protein